MPQAPPKSTLVGDRLFQLKYLSPLGMCANGINNEFSRWDKIFQSGPNISRKSGPRDPLFWGSKYVVTAAVFK